MDQYGNHTWNFEELAQTPMKDLSRRGRHIKRRLHRRAMRENPAFKCECTPQCDWFASPKWKIDTYGKTLVDDILTQHREDVEIGKELKRMRVENKPMVVPLSFWFCRDPGLSIPQVSIPYGMRTVNIIIGPDLNTGG